MVGVLVEQRVGKQRANQLANGEPISLDTIKRMFSYLSRHAPDLIQVSPTKMVVVNLCTMLGVVNQL